MAGLVLVYMICQGFCSIVYRCDLVQPDIENVEYVVEASKARIAVVQGFGPRSQAVWVVGIQNSSRRSFRYLHMFGFLFDSHGCRI